MQISDGERLLAVMLADVMKALSVSSDIDPGLVAKALTSGQAWALDHAHEALFNNEEDDDAVVMETGPILAMCSAVEDSIADLTSIELELIPENDRRIFLGFDANNEEHYGVAKTMIEDLGHWQGFKGRPLNSHCPTLDRYRRQLETYREVAQGGFGNLPVFQISQVIAAGREATVSPKAREFEEV
jgi:uncharacterized protein YfbU (UPF0304 family)